MTKSEYYTLDDKSCLGGDVAHERTYYVYILVRMILRTSKRNGTLYTEVTNDLLRRVSEHRTGAVDGFTKKYKVDKLVYFESTNDVTVAIRREKQIKKWYRKWKIELIEAENPGWNDLYEELIAEK